MNNKITRRGVLYIGLKCNANCQFCYYRYKTDKNWKSFKEVKAEASRFKNFYNNQSVDITGGEPTIYPDILKLVSYCHSIDLKPTLITNALVLSDKKRCLEFEESGIASFKISLYGIGGTADQITRVNDTYNKQLLAIDNLNKLDIPLIFNITLNKIITKQLPEMANLAVEKKVKVVNFITFLPFLEWEDKINIEFQEKHSEMTPYLKEAIDILEKNNIEANVRYLPFCQLKGYEKNVYNYMQLSYDLGEWDFNSWGNFFLFRPSESWYEKEALRKRLYDCNYQKSPKCQQCSINYICDGFFKQYQERFGFGEEKPYQLGEKIIEPIYFIKHQKKFLNNSEIRENKSCHFFYLFKDPLLLFDFIKGRIKYLRRVIKSI